MNVDDYGRVQDRPAWWRATASTPAGVRTYSVWETSADRVRDLVEHPAFRPDHVCLLVELIDGGE